MKSTPRRIGIFGGSFHPPHKGHEEAALSFLRGAKLDELLVVPAFLPPHKELSLGAEAQHRLEMARLCFLPLSEKIGVSEIEVEKGEARYTLDTLREFSARFPEEELFLYVGSDMLFSFETWHEFQSIFPLCTLSVLARAGDADRVKAHAEYLRRTYGAAILELGTCREVSSTEVREELTRMKNSEKISPAVLSYIREHALYDIEKEK